MSRWSRQLVPGSGATNASTIACAVMIAVAAAKSSTSDLGSGIPRRVSHHWTTIAQQRRGGIGEARDPPAGNP
jgi:hypothetical protein